MRDSLVELGFRPISVVTRNVDLPEILSTWGLWKQREHPVSQTSASQRLRHTIEEGVWLRALKACANGALRILNLGDTLEALAVKREQWRPMSHGGISVTAGQP